MIRYLLRSKPAASSLLTVTAALAAAGLGKESKPTYASCSSCSSTNDDSRIQFRRLFPLNIQNNSQTNNNTSIPKEKERQSLHNSVLFIPSVLSTEECEVLRKEADRLLDDGINGSYRRDRYCEEDDQDEDEDISLRRVSVCDMSSTAQDLAYRIIKERVLPTMQRQTPHLLKELEGWDRVDANFEWAADEPSVNRYTVGGQFEPHRDGYPLTIVLLLSKDGDFDGGGTEFFESKQTLTSIRNSDKMKSVILHPPQGTALCFNGDITHAGSPVTSGTRHVFVASFGIK